jgi:hypothetical protein
VTDDRPMLKIALDMLLLAGLLAVLQGEEPDWANLLVVAVIMTVANFAIGLLLADVLGLLVILPIMIIDGLIVMFFCHLPLRQAAIAVAVLLVYNFAYYYFVPGLFATA